MTPRAPNRLHLNRTRFLSGWLLLTFLDSVQRSRKLANRTLVQFIGAGLIVGFAVMLGASLHALANITDLIRSMRRDSLVGLESAIAMRGTVRTAQMNVYLQRQEGEPANGMNRTLVTDFESAFKAQYKSYADAAFDDIDRDHAQVIHTLANEFTNALQREQSGNRAAGVVSGELTRTATLLLQRINSAYEYNRARLNEATLKADHDMAVLRHRLSLLTGAIGLFVITIGILFVLHRWLDASSLGTR